MAEEKRKKLVFAICEFLQKSIKDGIVTEEGHEGLEVAIQCIGQAFGVDIHDASQAAQYSVKPTGLPAIFDVFLTTQAKKISAKSPSEPPTTAAPASASSPIVVSSPSPQPADINVAKDRKVNAEELKSAGNKAMTEKKYAEAITHYTSAIALDGFNAVYYANRAAAYSQNNEHEKAVEDSKRAVQIDSEYSKAYSRMGHAYFSLGKFEEAVDAYQQALRLDPGNATLKQSLAASQSKLAELSTATSASRGASGGGGGGGLAGLAGLAGLGGGPGGIDLASLMNNPQLMQMASSMMSNPAFASMLQNPNIGQMAQNLMRDPQALSNIMNDPNIASLMGNQQTGAPDAGSEEQ
ncbi:hypothetical protein SeMB42_g02822 [Synchytrium endobioticum]|uniref:SGTA homodimerisation domain-containing protein n=1 Tax=Synchytrium endobioticum TaxID=286115 RepID=A0A507DI16_9FUNG|nr:hypothetical protein SeMB42_g02822 [Synchytrium endobioticum]TPX50538.1 hypothetical protein SeLEV6574_g00852 [Synchytrium endobioticum]